MANNTGKRKKTNINTNSKKVPKREEHSADIRNDIIVIAIISVCALLFIGNLGVGGVLGDSLAGFFFGLFGLFNYMIPIYISIVSVFCLIRKDEKDTRFRAVFFVLLIFLICLFVSLIMDGSKTIGPVSSFYFARENHQGGGFFGGALAEFFVTVFGLVGAYIIDILLISLSIIAISGFSVLNWLKQIINEKKEIREQNKKIDTEDRRLRREEREKQRQSKRQEEKRLEREREGRKLEEEKLHSADKTDDTDSPIHVLNIDTPKVKSKVNSNIHPGRPFRNNNSDVKDENVLPETDPNLPRRDRQISGMTFNTEIAPIRPQNPAQSDDMNEIDADTYKNYAENIRSYEDNDKIESDNSAGKDPFEDVTVNTVTVHSNETSESVLDVLDKIISTDTKKDYNESNLVSNTAMNNPVETGKSQNNNDKITNQIKPEPPILEMPAREVHTVEMEERKLHDIESTDKNVVAKVPSISEKKPYVFPSIDLLKNSVGKNGSAGQSDMQKTADKLELILKNFGINARVTGFSHGPSVTRYELLPEMGVKVAKILNLQDDIKMNLAATDIRIEAPIPGKNAIGIEVPNKKREAVGLRELVDSKEFKVSKSKIAFGLGLDIAGNVIISDIAKMPHLLIAGATGSGKSVCINTIIMSILYKATPEEVKFIMIDPKVVELSVYNGIPHLLIPVVTDPKKASGALQWAVKEMMDRYKKFADCQVRDISGYNSKIIDGRLKLINNGQEVEIAAKKMPQLVVIVDELADLMMVASKEVEESICRLAQLARAAGIHIVIATQRPSVNVITGLIKANMPSRIALSVTSGVDSRTIIDMVGAERLLGHGDMLYYPQEMSKPVRLQGAYVDDEEVQKVASFLRNNNSISDEDTEELQRIQEDVDNSSISSSADGYTSIGGEEGGFDKERDEFFADAARLVIDKDKGSIGMLQRNFKIGFNRAARIVDQLEEFGIVGPEEGTKPRKILVTIQEFEQMWENEGGSN
jgi:S-DNA-T family DNA segregation ATPase FtsK/SpoIIIE